MGNILRGWGIFGWLGKSPRSSPIKNEKAGDSWQATSRKSTGENERAQPGELVVRPFPRETPKGREERVAKAQIRGHSVQSMDNNLEVKPVKKGKKKKR